MSFHDGPCAGAGRVRLDYLRGLPEAAHGPRRDGQTPSPGTQGGASGPRRLQHHYQRGTVFLLYC